MAKGNLHIPKLWCHTVFPNFIYKLACHRSCSGFSLLSVSAKASFSLFLSVLSPYLHCLLSSSAFRVTYNYCKGLGKQSLNSVSRKIQANLYTNILLVSSSFGRSAARIINNFSLSNNFFLFSGL